MVCGTWSHLIYVSLLALLYSLYFFPFPELRPFYLRFLLFWKKHQKKKTGAGIGLENERKKADRPLCFFHRVLPFLFYSEAAETTLVYILHIFFYLLTFRVCVHIFAFLLLPPCQLLKADFFLSCK